MILKLYVDLYIYIVTKENVSVSEILGIKKLIYLIISLLIIYHRKVYFLSDLHCDFDAIHYFVREMQWTD